MHLLSSSLQCSSNWPIARIGVHWSAYSIWSVEDDNDDDDSDDDDDGDDYDDNGDAGDVECEVLMMRKRMTKADAADDNQAVCIGPQ